MIHVMPAWYKNVPKSKFWASGEEADLSYKRVNMIYLHLLSVPELVLKICLN